MINKCVYCKHWEQTNCHALPSQHLSGAYTWVGLGRCHSPLHEGYKLSKTPADWSCIDFMEKPIATNNETKKDES